METRALRHGWLALGITLLVLQLLGATPAYADDPQAQVIGLVNAVRAQHDLPPLLISDSLTAAASAYAHAMAAGGFFGHFAPDGSTPISRDEAAGYTNWDDLGENLAAGQTSASEAVAAWVASPEHLPNILSPNYRETGVGLVVVPGSPYVYYWVQEFGDRPDAAP